MPIDKLKSQHQNAKSYLAKLATYIYQIKDKDHQYLKLVGLNKAQVEKYQRYELFFKPEHGYAYYQPLFEAIFNDQSKKVFELLSDLHPYGIAIWINPPNAKQYPLLEHNGIITLSSILSASHMLMADKKIKLKNQIDTLFDENNKQIFQERLERKYKNILKEIEERYKLLKAQIEAIYAEKIHFAYASMSRRDKLAAWLRYGLGLDKDKPNIPPEVKQFHKVKHLVTIFQTFSVAKLAVFSQLGDHLPENKDYKAIYKELSIYEQKTKLQGFYKNKPQVLDSEAYLFNQDIFTFTLEETDTNGQQIARTRFHKRHYNLSAQQVSVKLQEEDLTKNNVNAYKAQPTATSHSPDYWLANSAIVEEGIYNTLDNNFAINFVNSRHGSPAPNEIYKQTLKPLDRHEATYRTFLNMEQHLQQLRAHLITGILLTLPRENQVANITEISNGLAYEITHLLHEKALKIKLDPIRPENSKPISHQVAAAEVTDEASIKVKLLEEALAKLEIKFNLSDTVKQKILEAATDLIDVKNIHTHLITPTGIGSFSESQGEQFWDARIAQYATWQIEKDEDGYLQNVTNGYFYTANGVNRLRYDTSLRDQLYGKLKGNNTVGILELYRHIYNFDNLSEKEKSLLNNYLSRLQTTITKSRQYINAIETYYEPKRIAIDNLENLIKEKKVLFNQCSKNKTRLNSSIEKDLKKEIKSLTINYLMAKERLAIQKSAMDLHREAFRFVEIELHEAARNLNEALYQKLLADEANIEALANSASQRSEYLSKKAFLIAAKLFNETNCFGIDRWKLAKNNGIMQTMIHLAAEMSNMFASGGCKSANDREMLLALLISETSKLLNTNEPLNLEALQNLLIKAQEGYALHISRHQTELDRSGNPKIGEDVLEFATRYLKQNAQINGYSEFSTHKRLSFFAAHKRKKVRKLDVKSMALYSFEESKEYDMRAIYHIWLQMDAPTEAPKITALLQLISFERGLSKVEKIAELKTILETISNWQKSKIFYRGDSKEDILWLHIQIEAQIFIQQAKEKAKCGQKSIFKLTEYSVIKETIDSIKNEILRIEANSVGLKQMKALIIQYQNAEKESVPTLEDLLKLFSSLKFIASLRTNDWTSTFANRGLFKKKRPLKLQKKIFNHLASLDIDRLMDHKNSANLHV